MAKQNSSKWIVPVIVVILVIGGAGFLTRGTSDLQGSFGGAFPGFKCNLKRASIVVSDVTSDVASEVTTTEPSDYTSIVTSKVASKVPMCVPKKK